MYLLSCTDSSSAVTSQCVTDLEHHTLNPGTQASYLPVPAQNDEVLGHMGMRCSANVVCLPRWADADAAGDHRDCDVPE